MTTAKLLTGGPLVRFNEDGLRVLQDTVSIDLGVYEPELHEWAKAEGQEGFVQKSAFRTTILMLAKGFIYNGASIPGPLMWLMGAKELYEVAGLFHDALYQRSAPRGTSDGVFRRIARSGSKRVTKFRGALGWFGLRVGGWWTHRKWRRNKEN